MVKIRRWTRQWIGLVTMAGTLLTGFAFAGEPPGTENAPLTVILLGPPGSGKGTHAGPLSAHLGIPHISTGDLFRENIRNQTPIGKKAKDLLDQGKLVPDEVALEMLVERTSREDCNGGYILDGFPRTLPQARALDEQIGKTHRIVVLHFQIADDLLVERIAGRLACKQCGSPYHIKYTPPKQEGLCDKCGGPLYRRPDDKEATLKKRLEVYHRETAPLIDYYADRIHNINSASGKEQVFTEVLQAVPSPILSDSHS